MFPRSGRVALFLGVLSLLFAPAGLAEQAKVVDEPGKRLSVIGVSGKPVLTVEYAREMGEDGKVTFDTAKVFYHVVAPDGKSTLTKGPGGTFPHHRGIYIGWNKLKHSGKSHDLWHVRNTSQKLIAFTEQKTTDAGTAVTSRIDWLGTEGKPVLEETRTVTVHHDANGAYAVIDFVSVLSATHGAVELGGDPEHAGVQFRPSQQVADNKSATYVFPVDDPKANKHAGLDWATLTFDLDGEKWSVQQMSHPSNPDADAKWSAYRDYGRFGEFPVFKIADGESVTLRYRFRVTKGAAPQRDALNNFFAEYAGSSSASAGKHPDTNGEGWAELFKDDLSNADFPKGVWTAEGGSITASKDQAIWTKTDYENFVLDLEFKVGPEANSGVIVYSTDTKNWIPGAIEVQILDDAGDKWKNIAGNGKCAAVYGHVAPTKDATKPAGEWNRMTITCEGPQIDVVLNGEHVTNMDLTKFTDAKVNPDGSKVPPWLSKPKAGLPTKGKIGFQGKHGGANIWFRNIKIKTLGE
ncbi:MAG: DUF6807 family protein [Planctomycetota bacterium]